MFSGNKIRRVMLVQPNFSCFGRRSWRLLPYGLGLLNAILKKVGYDSWIFDPNFTNLSEEEIRRQVRRSKPDAVGITTFSSEYVREVMQLSRIIKEESSQIKVILGGILATVRLDIAIQDTNVDYFIIGEGEYRLPRLLDELNRAKPDFSKIDGIASREPWVIQPMKEFIPDLDVVPFPDYGGLNLPDYMNYAHKYSHGILPRQFPFMITVTSRGCPYRCIFCASGIISGRKVRMRSAANVLREIDNLYQRYGIKEVIFLDDHLLANRNRIIEIMRGIIDRKYGITWKCVNFNMMHLDEEILNLMKKSGCYQLTLSIESGNSSVLRKIIKKPMDLKKAGEMIDIAKKMDFELAVNFVFGFPGETREQIGDTLRYAQDINADIVNFHIATPLPKTELMEIAMRGNYLKTEDSQEQFGYTKGVIETSEFKPIDLQILRANEWDRINFSDVRRKAIIAKMEGISIDELEDWRMRTRRNLGTTTAWEE